VFSQLLRFWLLPPWFDSPLKMGDAPCGNPPGFGFFCRGSSFDFVCGQWPPPSSEHLTFFFPGTVQKVFAVISRFSQETLPVAVLSVRHLLSQKRKLLSNPLPLCGPLVPFFFTRSCFPLFPHQAPSGRRLFGTGRTSHSCRWFGTSCPEG